jgi:hypothetical protein
VQLKVMHPYSSKNFEKEVISKYFRVYDFT